MMIRRIMVATCMCLATFHGESAAAQSSPGRTPIFDCTLEHHIRLLDPGHPSLAGITMSFASGFVFDAASGMFRWRFRASGTLHEPERWTLVQRGSGGNDWIASFSDEGRPRVLRIRPWGDHPGRFVLFDELGSALTGRCQ